MRWSREARGDARVKYLLGTSSTLPAPLICIQSSLQMSSGDECVLQPGFSQPRSLLQATVGNDQALSLARPTNNNNDVQCSACDLAAASGSHTTHDTPDAHDGDQELPLPPSVHTWYHILLIS
jgi:hypothetical protein